MINNQLFLLANYKFVKYFISLGGQKCGGRVK
jgi:hypothetical protein